MTDKAMAVDKFNAALARDLLRDAGRFEAEANALESDARELRKKAERARKGAEYVSKSVSR